jgi:ubiquinone biosynthesis protein
MPVAQNFTRALALLWHFVLCAIRLGFQLIVNRVSRRREPVQLVIGRNLANLFEALGPTYIKLGQILSTRRDLLSEPFIQELGRLRDRLSPLPFRVVGALFRQEFRRDLADVFSEFDSSPIASASVASVYRGRLHDGQSVAIKILRPNVATLIQADLRLIRLASRLLGKLPALRQIPLLPAIEEFGVCLERQLDFRNEALANKRISALVVSEPNVLIPTLVEEFCGSSILTMHFIEGLCGTQVEDKTKAREALLAALRTLYAMIFVEGFIHCDLHQGNLHFLPNGLAVFIDFGFMAELQPVERRKFAEFFYSIYMNDGVRCTQIMHEMAIFIPPDLAYDSFKAEVVALIKSISGAKAREFQVARFALNLFNIQRRHRIIGTTAFIMAIVSLLVFEGIAKDIYPDLDFQGETYPFIVSAFQ